MMFSWLKYLNSFISLNVRKQNMEWSKGVIFLIATFCPDGLCKAELYLYVSPIPLQFLWEVCLPNHSICTFANNFLNIILFGDIEGYLSRAWGRSAWHFGVYVIDMMCVVSVGLLFTSKKVLRWSSRGWRRWKVVKEKGEGNRGKLSGRRA